MTPLRRWQPSIHLARPRAWLNTTPPRQRQHPKAAEHQGEGLRLGDRGHVRDRDAAEALACRGKLEDAEWRGRAVCVHRDGDELDWIGSQVMPGVAGGRRRQRSKSERQQSVCSRHSRHDGIDQPLPLAAK